MSIKSLNLLRKKRTAQLSMPIRPQIIMKQIIKNIIKNISLLGPSSRHNYNKWTKPFQGSNSYWRERYEMGGNSGKGSYNKLAEFKADILNKFVLDNEIRTIIEYGCGDGNQLNLSNYPSYIGFDVSPKAISMCLERFTKDDTKAFKLMETYNGETAEITLSLDVIYHLIEDNIFVDYMNRLFDSASRFVIIYSSDTDENPAGQEAHVRHRHFTKWITNNKKEWKLLKHIPNKHPYKGNTKTGSFADLYIYANIE